MSETKEKIFCPFDSPRPCIKERCALWIDETEECSFKAIAKWLGEISITLLDLDKK